MRSLSFPGVFRVPTAAQILNQRLEELAVGEDVDQSFVGRFPTDFAGATFKYTLSADAGGTPALVLVSTDAGEMTFDAVASGSEFIVTFTVYYRRAGAIGKNTLDLEGGLPAAPKLYAFDLWRTDAGANVRLAAGVQPVVVPARLEA